MIIGVIFLAIVVLDGLFPDAIFNLRYWWFARKVDRHG